MRFVEDGLGEVRHLGGLHFSPPGIEGERLKLTAPDGFVEPEKLDLPIYDVIPIEDQGRIGSCTGQATRRVASAALARLTGAYVRFSALFGYAMTRLEEFTPLTEDSGATIPASMRGLNKRGICVYDLWPDSMPFDREPSDEAKKNALDHQGLLYYHAPDHRTILASLAQGFGLSVGISVYSTLMDSHAASTGEILFPKAGSRRLGGHNFVIRGWDANKAIGDDVGAYRVDNSWGERWGDHGRCWLPRRYVDAGLLHEATSLRLVEVP